MNDVNHGGPSRIESASAASELQKELWAEILHHKKWQSRDFTVAQILVWVGLLASIFSTLYGSGVLDKDVDNLTAAIIGSIPGAVLILDRTFKFTMRASWHAKYRALLSEILRKLRYANSPVAPESQEFSRIELEMEQVFPPLDPTTPGGKPG